MAKAIIMKNFKKIIPLALAVTLSASSFTMIAKADSSKVVTLGTNLSADQKKSMYEYFGTSEDKVDTIEVTNEDERKYMEGIASEAQIGHKTFSCSYVEPTTSGGIQVKVANLTYVTSSMIASTLSTSGVENCNVVAASPIEVSGTGALTGIMMAYESASGEKLDEGKKEAATEELVATGELADDVGQDKATELMNGVKEDVIEDGIKDKDDIEDKVEEKANDVGVNLTDEQKDKIVSLMEKISQYDYDVKSLQQTLNNLEGKSEGFFSKIASSIKGLFGGSSDNAGGIISQTKDDILGSDVVSNSTLDDIKDKVKNADTEGWWDKIVNYVKELTK
ncbi:MAG: DUF1002 domain-containing protein [Lachnospiraceae bacterium]|nr:DUF1002 domain-containing protein [Lachnospiraceae bacterium]